MTKNHIVKFLLGKEQLRRLKANASAKGHKTLSAYLREIALNRDIFIEKMLVEILNEVVKNKEEKR
jgi:hypothetical protein